MPCTMPWSLPPYVSGVDLKGLNIHGSTLPWCQSKATMASIVSTLWRCALLPKARAASTAESTAQHATVATNGDDSCDVINARAAFTSKPRARAACPLLASCGRPACAGPITCSRLQPLAMTLDAASSRYQQVSPAQVRPAQLHVNWLTGFRNIHERSATRAAFHGVRATCAVTAFQSRPRV